VRVSDYSVMMMETRDLRVSILRAYLSRLCLSHVERTHATIFNESSNLTRSGTRK
jgi:hypothetical protein